MTLWCKRLDFYTVPQFFSACGAILYYFFLLRKKNRVTSSYGREKLHPGALCGAPPEGVKGAGKVRHSACVGPAGALASEAMRPPRKLAGSREPSLHNDDTSNLSPLLPKKPLRACSPLRNSNLTFFALLVRKKIVYNSLIVMSCKKKTLYF